MMANFASNNTKQYYLPGHIKSIQFDFADELKIGDVRCKHLTQITIKVQLFRRLPYQMWLSSKVNRLWVIGDSKKDLFKVSFYF